MACPLRFLICVLLLITCCRQAWAGADFHLNDASNELVMKAKFIFYDRGNRLITEDLAKRISNEVQTMCSRKGLTKWIGDKLYRFRTEINYEIMNAHAARELAARNKEPSLIFMLVDKGDPLARSYISRIGSNTGVFYLTDDLGNSTIATHEFAHTLGLGHADTDWRGKGPPAIMCSDATWVDPEYQKDPSAKMGEPGAKMAPSSRIVRQEEIDGLFLGEFENGKTTLGKATNKLIF